MIVMVPFSAGSTSPPGPGLLTLGAGGAAVVAVVMAAAWLGATRQQVVHRTGTLHRRL